MDLKPYETKMQTAVDHFEQGLKKIRTGRAHPDMLDGITVDAYGTRMPLNQVGNITVPEPQLLQVNPFDPANVKAIVEAIREDQALGFNPSDDGKLVRVPVPPLTEERRHQIVKQLSEKTEEAKIALRAVRQAAQKEAKRMKEAKEMGDNDVARSDKEIDKMIQDFNAKVDALAKAKEQEILTI